MSPGRRGRIVEAMSGPGSADKAAASVEETARDFWANRPVRPRVGRKIAGVSAAIGQRYGIDPVLVRVAFVVGAFYGGASILVYLLGWLLLPREELATDGGPAQRNTSGVLAVVLVLAMLPASMTLFGFEGLVGLGVFAVVLFLLHRNYRDRGQVTPPGIPADAGESGPPAADSATESTMDATTQPMRTQPPKWDPLGAAPFAWDLPEPTEPPPPAVEEPSPRRSITLVTLGLALLATGIAVAASASAGTALAIGLGVLGLGMVAGSVLRGGRGLIGAAIPVGLLALAANSITNEPWQGVSEQSVRPAAVEEIAPQYRTSAGNLELHLDDLDFTGKNVTTHATVGVGNISVYLPENVDATVRCGADFGHILCLDTERSGRAPEHRTTDLGPDGPGGGQLTLDLRADTGNVEVFRG